MELTFEDFKKRALDNSLSPWEKIGFPNSYRKDVEKFIFNDIKSKLDLNNSNEILDIGCGCSELVLHLIRFCKQNNSQLYLNDSEEMLKNIQLEHVDDKIKFLPGMFPEVIGKYALNKSTFDAILVYSVIQYVFNYQNLFGFIHECINLLKPGGRLLIGDIPNFNCRGRFLESSTSVEFKENREVYSVQVAHDNADRLDDSVVMSILLRFRNFGCETYILPQQKDLPFANRREDILIVKR